MIRALSCRQKTINAVLFGIFFHARNNFFFAQEKMKCPLGNAKCECSMKEKLRKVFTDHVIYTKAYLEKYCTPGDDAQKETSVLLKRLLKNQEDIGSVVKSVIGVRKSEELVNLLKQHIKAAGAMIAAVVVRDKTDLDQALRKVFSNSRKVAEFLSALNPEALPYNVTKEMFDTHNKQVYKLAVRHGYRKYKEEVELFDEYLIHMLRMSDAIAKALE